MSSGHGEQFALLVKWNPTSYHTTLHNHIIHMKRNWWTFKTKKYQCFCCWNTFLVWEEYLSIHHQHTTRLFHSHNARYYVCHPAVPCSIINIMYIATWYSTRGRTKYRQLTTTHFKCTLKEHLNISQPSNYMQKSHMHLNHFQTVEFLLIFICKKKGFTPNSCCLSTYLDKTITP